jgi:hypothetical protein
MRLSNAKAMSFRALADRTRCTISGLSAPGLAGAPVTPRAVVPETASN